MNEKTEKYSHARYARTFKKSDNISGKLPHCEMLHKEWKGIQKSSPINSSSKIQ